GDGGNIAVTTSTGNIEITEANSFSSSLSGPTGRGGEIRLTTEQGNVTGITDAELRSFAVSQNNAGSGNGGNVILETNQQIANLDIFTAASGAEAGTVAIKGRSDLVLDDTDIVTSTTVTIEDVPVVGTFSFEVGGIGQSGDVNITSAGDLTLSNSSIESTTQGSAPAGDVRLTSPGLITLQSDSSISSDTDSLGDAGEIRIESDTGVLLTGPNVALNAISNAAGNAGSIELDAPTLTVEAGAQISTLANADGAAGDIRLTTGTLSLTNGGEILASSSGAGDGGEIIIDAATAVNLGEGVQDFAPIISVATSGAGSAGDITINTPRFTLSETARITATATATATNTEAGGSITLNASDMDLAGTVGIFAETEGQAPAGTLTLQPFDANFEQGAAQFDPHLLVTLTPGAAISASTSGQGQGGDLRIFAPESIAIAGPGRIAVETLGPGNGGDIEIRTRKLTLTDGVEISASTLADAPIPIITITTVETVEFIDGPPIFAEAAEDAGQTLNTARIVSSEPGTPLESISGSLSEAGDIDIYQIYLSGDGTFSATTVGGADIDTQLFLFSAPDGSGIYGNDDDGSLQSTLPAQDSLTPTTAGIYYLAVSGFGNNPITALGETIFALPANPNFANLLAPTDEASTSPLADWSAFGADIGDYIVSLTGVEVNPTVLPTFTEMGDAGQVPATAQVVSDAPGASLGNISGSIAAAGDVDLYQIYLSGNNTFSATTVDGANIDTQLFLFNAADGSGIYGNDDDGSLQSTLPAQSPLTPTEAGLYYLAVSSFGDNPLTASGDTIFSSFDPPAVLPLLEPIGPGGASPLDGWTDFSSATGDYTISLTGAEFEVESIAVPTTIEQENTVGFLEPWDAGNITIFAEDFTLTNGATVRTNTAGIGDGGSIDVNTGSFNLSHEAAVQTNTTGTGNGGRIDVIAEDFTLTSGGAVQTNTTDIGAAGIVNITVDNTLSLEQSTIAASTSPTSTGAGGDINIDAGMVQLSDSNLTVNSQGQGVGGDITVAGDALFLEQGSAIDAATASSDGGNVELSFTDVVLLSDQSKITATAGLNQGAGNGGDIDIQTEFLIGQPEGLNQIIANAFAGNGGNINIAATSILGEQFLNIAASSELGLPGTVDIDTPDTDPFNSLVELPTDLVNASSLIAEACAADGSHARSQFVVTGPGGLPILPTTHPTSLFLLPDLGPLTSTPLAAIPATVTEAQNWSVAANGNIVLEASPLNPLETLLGEASQAYQQADYRQAATLWTEAATTLAQGDDALAYASTLSNLALAYHHLGEWDQAQAAIATTQHILTPEVATAQPWLLAQTLNTQASLQLARGDAQAALSNWQLAAEAYTQAGNEGGQLRVQLNQTQAWQSLGFQQRAATQLEAIATALAAQPPSAVQAVTLLSLGNVLRAQGEAERSQQTLETALAVTQPLQQPHLTSAILLNLGHTAQVQTQPGQALDYYQQALKTASTPLGQFQAQVSQLDLLLTENPSAAEAFWSTLEPNLQAQTTALPASREAMYAQLHLAATLLQANSSANSQSPHPSGNALATPEQIQTLLDTVGRQAQRLGDPLAQTYTLGYQAQVYSQTQQWAVAASITTQALQQAQILDAPEMIYQWARQLGQVRQAQGDRPGAIAAYTEAIDALSVVRVSLNAASDDVQFTFRDTVEPVYRELVKLLLQGEAGQPAEPASLEQARLLVENLQLAELQDYFQDGCIQGESIIADAVDPTAAVIYPIVLDDRLDVIVSVAGQPMHHHSTPIVPGQVEET
ncbi:MAG: DVUA0089 family protein, partial [Cyanobacteria bacterium P01_F01_bin.86]